MADLSKGYPGSVSPASRYTPARNAARPPPPPEGSVATGELWRILRARRLSLLVVAVLVALAGSGYALLAPSLYTATAQILIDPRDHQVVDRSLIADAQAPDSGVTQVESQARLVESDTVLLRVVGALDLVEDPEFGPARPGQGWFARMRAALWPSSAPVAQLKPEAALSETLRAMRRRLSVRRGDKTLIIDVVFSAHDPVKATRIAGAIADAYVADTAHAREQAAEKAAHALSSRLEALQERTKKAETALEEYKASAGFVGSNGQPVIDAQLAAGNTDLSNVQAQADAAQARLDQVRAMQRDGLFATSASDAGSPVLSGLRTQMAAQAQALAKLRVVYGPRHPTVLAAQAELRHAQGEVQAEVARAARVAEADAERARAEVGRAQERLEALKEASVETNARTVRLRELQREADTDRSVYQSFLTRSGELAAQAGVDVANARIISQPLPPRQSSWPPRGLIVVASALAGIALGTAWALIGEYLRPTILSRAELSRSTGARLVGSVSAKALSRVTPAAATMVDLRDVATGATLLRLLRQQTRPVKTGRARCIGIISLPQERRERSRLATLMAGMAARQGLRVVVIGTEPDAAGPSEASGSTALQVVSGPLASGPFSAPSGKPGRVTRLSAGLNVALSTPGAADELLGALGAHFDVVIADIDDLVGSVQSSVIAAASDDLVVVAREGKTDESAIRELVDLADAGGRAVTAAVLVGDAGSL